MRSAKPLDADPTRDPVPLQTGKRIRGDVLADRIDELELPEARDSEGAERALRGSTRGLLRGHRSHSGQPTLRQRPHLLATHAAAYGHLTETQEEAEHLRDVAVGGPPGGGPRIDRAVLEGGER